MCSITLLHGRRTRALTLINVFLITHYTTAVCFCVSVRAVVLIACLKSNLVCVFSGERERGGWMVRARVQRPADGRG